MGSFMFGWHAVFGIIVKYRSLLRSGALPLSFYLDQASLTLQDLALVALLKKQVASGVKFKDLDEPEKTISVEGFKSFINRVVEWSDEEKAAYVLGVKMKLREQSPSSEDEGEDDDEDEDEDDD
jgi:hypothetical protein